MLDNREYYLTDEEIWTNWYEGSGFQKQMKTFPENKLAERDEIIDHTRQMIIESDRISSDAASQKAYRAGRQSRDAEVAEERVVMLKQTAKFKLEESKVVRLQEQLSALRERLDMPIVIHGDYVERVELDAAQAQVTIWEVTVSDLTDRTSKAEAQVKDLVEAGTKLKEIALDLSYSSDYVTEIEAWDAAKGNHAN